MLTNKNSTGQKYAWLVVTCLLVLLFTSAVSAQSSGQCVANIFVEGTIAGYGGTAVGLAMDKQDNLYIADNVGDTSFIQGPLVSKVTPQGVFTLVVPPGILGDVTALAFDEEGNLYVADGNGTGNGQPQPKNMIWKVTPVGTITAFLIGIN